MTSATSGRTCKAQHNVYTSLLMPTVTGKAPSPSVGQLRPPLQLVIQPSTLLQFRVHIQPVLHHRSTLLSSNVGETARSMSSTTISPMVTALTSGSPATPMTVGMRLDGVVLALALMWWNAQTILMTSATSGRTCKAQHNVYTSLLMPTVTGKAPSPSVGQLRPPLQLVIQPSTLLQFRVPIQPVLHH